MEDLTGKIFGVYEIAAEMWEVEHLPDGWEVEYGF